MPFRCLCRPMPPARLMSLVLPLTALLLTGCASGGLETGALGLAQPETGGTGAQAGSTPWQPRVANAREQEFEVKPETAQLIRKARALRETGEKAEALALLDKAASANTDPALVKERGLLSAELGKLASAEELLRKSIDPTAPDWRVHSALGATLSAAGRQSEARAEFARALELEPNHPSILNNLALTYAMEGQHDEAERRLRKAVGQGGATGQPAQNLALVLGLKGNIEEARKMTAAALPPEKAAANIAYLEKLRAGSSAVSESESASSETIRAAALAKNDDKPIMQLGATP